MALPRTVGLYFSDSNEADAALAEIRASGVDDQASCAPGVVDGAEGTIVALEVSGDPEESLRMAHDHGGVVVADVPDEWSRPSLD